MDLSRVQMAMLGIAIAGGVALVAMAGGVIDLGDGTQSIADADEADIARMIHDEMNIKRTEDGNHTLRWSDTLADVAETDLGRVQDTGIEPSGTRWPGEVQPSFHDSHVSCYYDDGAFAGGGGALLTYHNRDVRTENGTVRYTTVDGLVRGIAEFAYDERWADSERGYRFRGVAVELGQDNTVWVSLIYCAVDPRP